VCDFGYLDSPLSECNQARIRLLILVKVIFQICSVGRARVSAYFLEYAGRGRKNFKIVPGDCVRRKLTYLLFVSSESTKKFLLFLAVLR
jgi:hypothetical protein